jgi:hypothetical protein
MNSINYEDITIVKRGDLIHSALLKELSDIKLSDLKQSDKVRKAKCLIFRDFNNKLHVLKQ